MLLEDHLRGVKVFHVKKPPFGQSAYQIQCESTYRWRPTAIERSELSFSQQNLFEDSRL